MSTATPCELPSASALQRLLPGAYFFDAHRMEVPGPTHTALAYFLKAAARTLPWVNGLITLRNRVVAAVGLKNLGVISAADPLCRHNPPGRGRTGNRRVSQPACGDAHHGAVCSYACGQCNPGAGLSYSRTGSQFQPT
jgi:hypothetical protein